MRCRLGCFFILLEIDGHTERQPLLFLSDASLFRAGYTSVAPVRSLTLIWGKRSGTHDVLCQSHFPALKTSRQVFHRHDFPTDSPLRFWKTDSLCCCIEKSIRCYLKTVPNELDISAVNPFEERTHYAGFVPESTFPVKYPRKWFLSGLDQLSHCLSVYADPLDGENLNEQMR